MENVIVTGGTGFLGRNMIRRLCYEGYKVYALIRPESMNKSLLPKHKNVMPVICKLTDISENAELAGKRFDAFYHFAWGGVNRDQIDDESIHAQNMEDSLKVVQSAVELNCGCFIFAGSRSEYGPLREQFHEAAACHPQVAYGRFKKKFGDIASDLCRDTDTQYIHARIFSVYGMDDHPWSLIYTAISKMLRNETMEFSAGTQLWNFMNVRDMTDLLLTFQKNRNLIPINDNCIFNVATDDIRPLREFIEEIYRITGSTSELRFGSFKQSPDSELSLLPDMTKVESVFGWKQKISFADGIQEIVEQVKNNES